MEPKVCPNCNSLRNELHEKELEIKKLKNCIKKFMNVIINYSIVPKENIIQEIGYDLSFVSNTNEKETSENSSDSHSSASDEKSKPNSENSTVKSLVNNSHISENPDYVYHEKYDMYYSVSTGYYYDDKRGLMYEPQSQTYYKYNYDKQEYEVVSVAISENYENIENSVCDVVMQQVNNLKINEDKDKIECNEVPLPILDKKCDKNLKSDVSVSQEVNESYASKDWQLSEGSNLTIADVVKQVVNEHNHIQMSDYIYDETSRTYYNTSTGHIYDAERKLLYDPSNAAYYIYDEEKQSYEFYCQATPVTSTKEVSTAPEPNRKERLKSRKQFWKNKLKKPAIDFNESEIFKGDDSQSPEGEFSSPEDGEIFSSSDEDIVDSNDNVCIIKSPVKGSNESNNVQDDFPPSIRAIVEAAQHLKIGSLILITCSGGILGRAKCHPICIPELCVSKAHAEIKYNSGTGEYSIEDLGSQNGTFINEERLSKPKEKSFPRSLQHGDRLSLGSCKLLLHMHPGSETCDNCEPGQVLAELLTAQKEKHIVLTKEEKELQRRQAVRSMKKKYGLVAVDFETRPKSNPGYEDKAEIRRQTVGSDNPHEKTEQASLNCHMPKTNKGYKMLEKMGWKEGQTLGSKGVTGIPEPIPLNPWIGKKGLGSDIAALPLSSHSDTGGESKRSKTWIKARERYQSALSNSSVYSSSTTEDNIYDYP